jgi:dipeptidyl aminopeptidase/acylaminoacyl peptidase
MRGRTETLIHIFASTSPPSDFALAPDGAIIAYTREVNGYLQIFTLPVGRAGLEQRLTATFADCYEPRWSPDGKQLAFIRDHALWVMNADGSDARELIEHPAGIGDPIWSPDGSRLAFISRRRGWEHVWTIARDGSGLKQITTGADDAVDPVWSRDGKWIAFSSFRESDLTTRGIYIIPADGGAEILISPRGAWSGAPNCSPDARTLAYLSDHDGWFHIYLYDLQTRATRQLTRGKVEDGGSYFYNVDPRCGPLFSPDGARVAFIRHREGNFDLWIADANDGSARRVSCEDGHYRLVGWVDAERLAVTFDSPARPLDLWLLWLDGHAMQLTDSAVAALKSEEMTAPEWIAYSARDGLTIHAALLRPREEGRLPAVIFLHGGPNYEFGNFYYPLPQLLAQEGYVVLAPNVRGSTGYGKAFRDANFREWGHNDAFDAIDGARWLQQQDFVDPQRIAVMGPSYGGYLTLCALTLAPELFCAGVDMYGDSEIAESYRHGDRDGRLDLKRQMGTPEENPEGYRRGSPIYFAERIQAPLLILHGEDDMLVVPLMSHKMIEALKIEGKYFESHFYEDEEHGFDHPATKRDAWTRIIKFLNRHCKGEK